MITFSKEHIAYLKENFGKSILPLSLVENDRFPGGAPMEIFLHYKKETSLERLEDCFFKTVSHYNLFSSRLIMIDDHKFALQYCTDGVAKSILPPIPVASDHINTDDIKKMMLHVKTLPGEPLFAITGIPLADGYLGALSCSHAVCDGIGFMLFLHTWGCIIEGRDFPLPSPQRLFKSNPVCFDKIDKLFTPPLADLRKEIQNRFQYEDKGKKYFKKEYFSDALLNELKNKARSENEAYNISNNQIIFACLLKKYHNIILPNTDRIVLRTPISLRDVHPDIDPMYIGNAIFDSITEFKKNELNRMSEYEIAYRLKESIAHVRNEKHIKEISYLSEYGIEFNTDLLEKHYHSYNKDSDLILSNLAHLNDLESLGLDPGTGRLLYATAPVPAGFLILQEKSGKMFAQITSRYPL